MSIIKNIIKLTSNKKRFIFYLVHFLLLCGCMFFTSCAVDETTSSEGESATIRLQVKSESSDEINTRAFSDETISNLHVLVYNSSGELIGHEYSSTGSAVTVNTRSGTNCTIYAIANTGNSSLFDGAIASTETKLKTLVTNDISTLDGIKTGGESIIMCGSRSGLTIASGTNTPITDFKVTRLAAKITFTVSASSGITITGYAIKNLPSSSYLVAHPNIGEADITDAAVGTDGVSSWFNVPTVTTSSINNVSFYMYENRRGKRSVLSGGTGTLDNQQEKAKYAPNNSTYVEIYAVGAGFTATYKVYLGADNSSNYNIKRNWSYIYNIALNNTLDTDTRVSISFAATQQPESNSYILKPGGYSIRIPVSRANADGTTRLSNLSSGWTTGFLWTDNSNGMSSTGAVASVAADHINQGIVVRTGSAEGNAVVYVKDSSGNIAWSWHIWVTNYDPNASPVSYGTTYSYNNGVKITTFMDRNLGAKNATPGDLGSCGLVYQWGRKDPFTGPSAINALAGSDGLPIYNSSGVLLSESSTSVGAGIKFSDVSVTNNVNNTIQNPLTFYRGIAENNCDWFSNTAGVYNNNLWTSSTKTVYDPCPSGWRITASGDGIASPWNGLTLSNGSWLFGWNWVSLGAGYYPASGLRHYQTSKLGNVGAYAYSWSSTANSNGINVWYFDCNEARVSPSYCIEGYSRGYGMPARCVKI